MSDEIAVVRLQPCCPVCGETLRPPVNVPDLRHPTSRYVPLRCARGHWRGHGKFWTRQRDEEPMQRTVRDEDDA
jgi:hypothetical protein